MSRHLILDTALLIPTLSACSLLGGDDPSVTAASPWTTTVALLPPTIYDAPDDDVLDVTKVKTTTKRSHGGPTPTRRSGSSNC